ncbi:MAG: ABC transporter substrate-binding protein [Oscillospiraceae bacterium]|nr:ABC transporter substrate-binding protein [Oscillospiraceae bacterium]
MKKKLACLLLAACMCLSLAACGNSGSQASSEPAASAAADETPAAGGEITIGTISPNTGSLAAYGTAVTTAVDLAVEEINAAGGINGNQVKVVNADDQMDPTECLNAFNSLVSQGIGLIIGSVASSCTSAITDAANEESVVLLTPASTADSITTEDDYVFRACYADSFQGAIAAAYAKQSGYTDVGVVYCASDTYSKGLYDSFSSACKKYGVNVKAVESTASLDVQDYTNQFASMVKAGVNFVYAPYYYDVVGPYVVTQARAAGYKGIIMGADGYDGTPDYVVEGADLSVFNDVYWTNHYDPADTDVKVQSFVTAYQAKFNSTPNAISALAYDAVYMYKQAIEKAGSADAAAVRDAMADTSAVYSGVTGTFSLDESGTPAKGASIISFTSDGTSVTTKLVDVVKELPAA